MKYEEIIKLLDAGFTREEIMNMTTAPDPEPPADPETPGNPEPPADPQPVQDVLAEVMSQFKGAVDDMKKEIAAMNIMHSRQEDDKTGEDIIANIINPPKYNKKEGK